MTQHFFLSNNNYIYCRIQQGLKYSNMYMLKIKYSSDYNQKFSNNFLIINCYENRQDNNIMNNSNLIFGLIIMHKFLTLLVNVVWMNWFLYSLFINFEMIECTSTVTGWETIKLHLTNKKSCRLMIWWKFYLCSTIILWM